MTNAELIAILLRVGIKGENAVTVGQRLLNKFGGLTGLHYAPFADIKKQHRLGDAKAAIELGRRFHLESPEECLAINSPADAAALVSTVPPHAIVFAQEDRTVFALWYFRFALHQRSDMTVIATDLMPFTWYQETLRASYPSLIFPKFFPWPSILEEANPGSPVCFVQYVEQTKIQCSETSISKRF